MFPQIPTIKSISDLRYKTPAILNLVKKGKPVVITRDTRAEAVILSPALYEKWRKSFEDYLDTVELERAIEESAGKFYDIDELILHDRDSSKKPKSIKLNKPKKKHV